jgi:hypothetical protein
MPSRPSGNVSKRSPTPPRPRSTLQLDNEPGTSAAPRSELTVRYAVDRIAKLQQSHLIQATSGPLLPLRNGESFQPHGSKRSDPQMLQRTRLTITEVARVAGGSPFTISCSFPNSALPGSVFSIVLTIESARFTPPWKQSWTCHTPADVSASASCGHPIGEAFAFRMTSPVLNKTRVAVLPLDERGSGQQRFLQRGRRDGLRAQGPLAAGSSDHRRVPACQS